MFTTITIRSITRIFPTNINLSKESECKQTVVYGLSFAEDPDDLTIAHAWPEVTSPEVTWLLPLLFLPYYFSVFPPRTFFPRTYFLVVVQHVGWGDLYDVRAFPLTFPPYFSPILFFSRTIFPYVPPVFFPVLFSLYFFFRTFFLVVVQIIGWGCSLRRPHFFLPFFPIFFFRTFFPYICFPYFFPVFFAVHFFRPFFLVVVHNVGWWCSLRRPHFFLYFFIPYFFPYFWFSYFFPVVFFICFPYLFHVLFSP